MKLFIFAGALAMSALAPSAHAVLKLNDVLGTKVEFEIQGGRPEVCVLSKQIEGVKYKKKDLAHEQELCSFNAGVTAAACPKTNSSNPGIDFYTPPEGVSIESLTEKNCKVEGAKKEAKYKLSTSCSYTPSLLGYYHLSRLLGNVLNVPVAVVRTMDLDRHVALIDRGLRITKPSDLIHQTMQSLKKHLANGVRGPKGDSLFVEGGDQTYGGFQRNPRGEEFYKEFFNGGTDRAATFKAKNQIYRGLITRDFSISREWHQVNVQAMQQMKDLADMLVIDTIMSQEDRFGNIEFKEKYLYPTSKDGKFQLSDADKKSEIPAELQAKAVLIKEMMLKDNDCGVNRENRAKKAGLLNDIAHIDPKTYKRVLKFAQSGDQFREYFLRGMLFTESDYRLMMKNLKEVADLLKSRCQSGKLKLDLDLEKHFSGETLTAPSCEV